MFQMTSVTTILIYFAIAIAGFIVIGCLYCCIVYARRISKGKYKVKNNEVALDRIIEEISKFNKNF